MATTASSLAAASTAILSRTRALKVCPPLDLNVIADTEGLVVIRALPHVLDRSSTNWDRLIVVFSSYTSCQPANYRFEFRETVTQAAQPALFVFDLNLQWYVAERTYDRLCSLITTQLAALGLSQLVTLGDSMGGYAALAYGQQLPVDYALAITTRSGIGPDAVPDVRHQPQLMTPKLKLAVPTLRPVLRRLHSGAMIHGTRGPDRVHLPMLRPSGAVDHWIVPGHGHGIAAWMKQRKILFPVAAAAMRADATEVNRLMASGGAVPRKSLSARTRLTSLNTLDRLRGCLSHTHPGTTPIRFAHPD